MGCLYVCLVLENIFWDWGCRVCWESVLVLELVIVWAVDGEYGSEGLTVGLGGIGYCNVYWERASSYYMAWRAIACRIHSYDCIISIYLTEAVFRRFSLASLRASLMCLDFKFEGRQPSKICCDIWMILAIYRSRWLVRRRICWGVPEFLIDSIIILR